MKAGPERAPRWLGWLPALVLLWGAATWYLETRLDRLVISDTSLAVGGDFTDGLPGGAHWEFAGPADTLWQPTGGVDGGPALRLGGEVPGLLRYRLPLAYRADGYFVGLCLRAEGEAAALQADAWVTVRRAEMPRLQMPAARLIGVSDTDTWRCVLQPVTVPFGLDELVLQVELPASSGALWVDRVTIRPAFNPPAYRLAHMVLLAGWFLLGGLSLMVVSRSLGGVAGVAVPVMAVAAGALAVFGAVDRLPGDIGGQLSGCRDLLSGLAEPVFEALRIFTGDRSWRVTGTMNMPALVALCLFGFVAAWVEIRRFRWTRRPWGRLFGYVGLFGLAVPAVRLLVHAPGFGNLHWVLDPLAALAGAAAGALAAELLLRLTLRKAR